MFRLSIFLIFCSQIVIGQPKSKNYKKSIIQLGVLPGISTNGIHPGEYDNTFSVNIFTGYGHSTKYFELNGLAGFNTASSSGIHISGLANFIGGNGQVGLGAHEKYKELSKGYETNLSGFQFSGLINYVASNTFGVQVTLGVNNTANYLIGSQFSGLFNYVGSFTIGSQVSILGNFSKKSMSGVQLSLLFNSTQGGYSGIQVGAFNHARIIGSLKGSTSGFGTAIQIGVVNSSGDMGGWQFGILNSSDDIKGWQIGVVNLGKKVKGTQIGIINIYKNADQIDTKDGPAYGLLNFGYYINPRIYISELFRSNYGISTGKPMNSRVRSAFRTYYSYNEVLYSTNYNLEQDISWGVSYRAGLISFSRTLGTTTPQHFYSVAGEVGHVNWTTQDIKQLNLRYSIQVEGGIRMAKKLSWVFPFVGLSYNYLPKIEGNSPEFLAKSTGSGKLWAGYSVGVMFH